MIKLLYISEEAGNAFIEENEIVYHLQLFNKHKEVSSKNLFNSFMFMDAGFKLVNKEFENMDEVWKYLSDEYMKEAEKRGIKTPTDEQIKKIAKEFLKDIDKRGDKKFIVDYIERVKSKPEWLAKTDKINNIVTDFMELEIVKNDPELISLIKSLKA